MNKILTLCLVLVFVSNIDAQNLPPKQAYPLDIKQIHSGHSLTDPLFGQPWPGQYVNLMTQLRGTWAGNEIGKSTIPGSPMSYRWNNSSGYPDARNNIDEYALLSITEVANFCYPGGGTQQWYLDCIQEQRMMFSTWVNHAWNVGNNGDGAATLLWTNWISIDGSDGPFRLKLDTLGTEWETRQDYANDNRPSGAPPVYIIPGHKMMARLYDDVQAGIVPGITNFNQFFSDNIHTNSLGDYAIAMIHYACIYNSSPVGLTNNLIPNPPNGVQIPSPALAAYIQNMVWDVVTNYPRTGVYTNPVIAQVSANPSSGTVPLQVAFDGTASLNYGNDPLSYAWDFGDGNTGSGGTINHTYNSVGNYTASLIVTNADNDSDTAYVSITVNSASPPIANISANPVTGQAPLMVTFDGNNSIDYFGTGLTYSWTFGDGSTDNGVQVNHTFNNPGVYQTQLTVTDGQNLSHSTQVSINVQSPNNNNYCEYLLYEPFEYNSSIALHQLSGGIGFGGNWEVQDNSVVVPGYQTGNSSMIYLDLLNLGVSMSGGWQYRVAGRALDLDANGLFGNYISNQGQSIGSTANGEELWFSALMRKDLDNDDEFVIELHNQQIVWYPHAPNNHRIGIGYFGSVNNVGTERRWGLRINDNIYTTSIPLITNEPALLVLKIQFNNNNTIVDYYINPPNIGDSSLGMPTMTQTSNTPMVIRSLSYYGGSDPSRSTVDEIRMAEEFKCVAPDQNITFQQLPTAVISATPVSGQVPLIVSFNGSNSLDPNNTGLTFTWDFGDGSPVQNGVQVSHTYTYGGANYQVTLTVTDGNNNQNSATTNILVSNEFGYVPCFTTITCHSMAQCNGNGGEIQINTESGVGHILYSGTNVLPTSNIYTDLSAGVYHLSAESSSGCKDTFDIYITIDSSTCSSWTPPLDRMDIGTNLPGFADWEPHRAMKNFMKNTRGNSIPYTNECNCWSFSDQENNDIFSQMTFDDAGYPLYLPQSTTYGNIRLRYFISTEGRNMPPGQSYVLLYDGIGTFDLSGSLQNVQASQGRIEFQLQGDGTFWFQLTDSQQGNHVRNIRVLRISDEFEDIVAQPFYEEFLNKIEPFSVLRFMDWMHTNNNPMIDWSERTTLDRFSYGTEKGVPYELIIQLANLTKKDIWICVPHAVNEDFINEMALLFKNNLDSSINIYLEYSNEVWNWIFSQAQYNINNNPQGYMYGRAMAEKARRVFKIWHEVFEGQECRVKRVLGIQAGFNYLNEHILAHLYPDEWDYGSPTHYFGLDHGDSGVPRLDLLGASATVSDIMTNAFNHFISFKESVKRDYRTIQIFGKKVITYEGGQHFVGNVYGNPYEYNQAMWDAQSSQSMYDMYITVHDSIRAWGCELATNFSLAGPQQNIYGSWGVLEHIDVAPPYLMSSPKYQALLDLMPSMDSRINLDWIGNIDSNWHNPCNWSKSKVPTWRHKVNIIPNRPFNPILQLDGEAKSIKMNTNSSILITNNAILDVKETSN